MTKFSIIGAGLAGLLGGAILRDECDAIFESQPSLPNNHNALLRFRSSIVGDALNIPFTPVTVIKTVETLGNPLKDAISYSLKTNGTATLRSLLTADGKPEQRFIAPEDFIARATAKVTADILLGEEFSMKQVLTQKRNPLISTIPMPNLMNMLGYEHSLEFKAVDGYVTTAKLRNCNLCATIYVPSPEHQAYRVSITHDTLIIEYAFPQGDGESRMRALQDHPKNLFDHVQWALSLFGMDRGSVVGVPKVRPQKYAKILPIADDARKRFMLWATEHHAIYSLGRFATWRHGLLLDDLINDIRSIQRMAASGTYDARKK